MKAIITGASGTVGRALHERLRAAGHEVVAWDRSRVPVDVYAPMESFVRSEAPDVLFHLAIASRPTGRDGEGALVNHHWPSELGWITARAGVRFVFTSTAMVFTNDAVGPFRVDSPPDAGDGYGGEKRRTEARVFHQNPDARVVRLGWQIGAEPGTNTMVDFLDRSQRERGVVRASDRWLPACSFLEDTADALMRVAAMPAGLYHLDANGEGHSFHAIACALNALRGHPWRIEPTHDFIYDQRLLDDRLPVTSLRSRLPSL